MDRAAAEALNLDVSCTLLTPQQQEIVDVLRRRVSGSLEVLLRALDVKEPARRKEILDRFAADKAADDAALKKGLTTAAAIANAIPVVGPVLSAMLALAAQIGAAQGPIITPQPPREYAATIGAYRGFSPIGFYRGRGTLADPFNLARVQREFERYVDAKLDAYSAILGVELRCVFPRYHVAQGFTAKELQLLEGDADPIATTRALWDNQLVASYTGPRFLIDDLPDSGSAEFERIAAAAKTGGGAVALGGGGGQVPPLPVPPPAPGFDPERGRAWDLLFWAISRNVLVPQVSALRALLGNVVIGARREDNPYGFPIGPFRPDPVRAWEWNQGYDDAAARRAAPTGSLPYLSGALDQMIGTARSANPYGLDSGQPDPYRDRLRRDRGRLRGYDDGGGLFDAFRATAELLGTFNGSPPARLWRTYELVAFDGRGNVVALGAPQARTYRLSKDPAVGSGLAGAPGAWDQVTGGVPPGNFGLPARVLGRDATGRARPMSARFLRIKLGPSWAALLTR